MNINNVASWIAVIGFIAGGAWFVYQYDERIRTLETRINVLLGAGSSEPASVEGDGIEISASESELCATLAMRRVSAIENFKTFTQGTDIRKLMVEMNCISE